MIDAEYFKSVNQHQTIIIKYITSSDYSELSLHKTTNHLFIDSKFSHNRLQKYKSIPHNASFDSTELSPRAILTPTNHNASFQN